MGPGQLKRCPRCGEVVPLDTQYCPRAECGHLFRTKFTTPGATQQPYPPPPPDATQQVYQAPPDPNQPPYPPPPPYQQPYGYPQYPPPYIRQSTKEKVPAGLLAIFLGPFGAHLFYLGQTGPAIAMLLGTLFTCFYGSIITGPLSLAQGIIYLCSTDADFERKYVFEKRFF
jgi:TM2 domain-containing membrane protein YozV